MLMGFPSAPGASSGNAARLLLTYMLLLGSPRVESGAGSQQLLAYWTLALPRGLHCKIGWRVGIPGKFGASSHSRKVQCSRVLECTATFFLLFFFFKILLFYIQEA